jgi:hypothetical protein
MECFSFTIPFYSLARGEVQPVQRGYAHQERPPRAEVRAVPMQLSPHLQEHLAEDCLSQVLYSLPQVLYSLP